MDETNPKTKNSVYKEHMMPLKARISSIMLYDSDSGIEFLNKYNELLKKMDDLELGSIMAGIADLEFQIGQYESNKGKAEMADEKGNIILNNILDLLSREKELSTEDFEQEFLKLKDSYSLDVGSYDYSDADAIESRLYQLQASLLMRKIREEGLTDLHDEIQAEDVSGLTLALNTKINGLMENPSQEVQERVDKIKIMIMDRADAVYDPEVWRMLDDKTRNSTRREIAEQKPQKLEPQNVTALVPVREKKNGLIFPNLFRMFNRRKTLKIGNQTMELQDTVQIGDLTVKVKELSKIDMEYLASIMPEEMLREYEEGMLSQESREVQEKYLPDSKVPIYSFVKVAKEPITQFEFIDDKGNPLVAIDHPVDDVRIIDKNIGKIYTGFRGGASYDGVIEEGCGNVIHYARFIDKIIGGNLEQQLENELGTYFKKNIISNNAGEYSDGLFFSIVNSKLPIFANLKKSYEKLKKCVVETEIDFNTEEHNRREEFYKTHNLDSASRAQNWREQLKAPQSETMESQSRTEIAKNLVEIPKKIQEDSNLQKGSKDASDEEIDGH